MYCYWMSRQIIWAYWEKKHWRIFWNNINEGGVKYLKGGIAADRCPAVYSRLEEYEKSIRT